MQKLEFTLWFRIIIGGALTVVGGSESETDATV